MFILILQTIYNRHFGHQPSHIICRPQFRWTVILMVIIVKLSSSNQWLIRVGVSMGSCSIVIKKLTRIQIKQGTCTFPFFWLLQNTTRLNPIFWNEPKTWLSKHCCSKERVRYWTIKRKNCFPKICIIILTVPGHVLVTTSPLMLFGEFHLRLTTIPVRL